MINNDGIILIDKEKNMTSRDLVNHLNGKFHFNKIGHTGTLDPLATGLMVICINKGVKLVELLTNHDKSYIVTVKLGIKTDTYDITGNILEEDNNYHLTKEELSEVLNSFIGTYNQETPIYSSKKVNGMKLYEYARKNIPVTLPKCLVEIYDIELIDFQNDEFTFYTKVSKGTYIRSLVNDISNKLNIYMTMSELRRTSIDKYDIKDAVTFNNFSFDRMIPLEKILDYPIINIDNHHMLKEVCNGVKRKENINSSYIQYFYKNSLVAVYKKIDDYYISYQQFNNYYKK